MQSDVEPAIGHDRIRVRPGFADLSRREPEPLVKIERCPDIGRLDGQF
jgi:hypothetical protein